MFIHISLNLRLKHQPWNGLMALFIFTHSFSNRKSNLFTLLIYMLQVFSLFFFFYTTASRRIEATHRLSRYLSWRHGNRWSLEGETSAAFLFEQWEAARYGQSWPSRSVPLHGLSNKIACKTKSDCWFGCECGHWLLSRIYYPVF